MRTGILSVCFDNCEVVASDREVVVGVASDVDKANSIAFTEFDVENI